MKLFVSTSFSLSKYEKLNISFKCKFLKYFFRTASIVKYQLFTQLQGSLDLQIVAVTVSFYSF